MFSRLHLMFTFLLVLAPFYACASWLEQTNILSGSVGAATSWSWAPCDIKASENDTVKISAIEVSPDPPSPGQNLTVNVKGTVVETIEEGAYADVAVRLGRIKLLQKTFDLCEEARNANLTIDCPIEEGEYEVKHTVELPKEIPRAKFAVQVHAYSVEDKDMTCINININFMI